ncbi:MAG: nucleotide disphospho-sugar-binding domain-containing protein [Spirochaetota bacterium]
MIRIVVFGVPFTGHANPLYPVLRVLLDHGAEVVVVNDESMRERFESTGVRFRAYPRLPAYRRFFERARPTSMPDLAAGLMSVATATVPFALRVLDEEQPDCVLHDSIACWALLATRARSLTAVGLVTTFAFNLEMSREESSLRSRLRILGQLVAAFPKLLVRRTAMKARLRTRPLRIFETFMALERTNVVFTSREFQPQSDLFADRCHFVGTTAVSRHPAVGFPYERLDERRPVVYISLGTILHRADLLRRFLDAFASYPAQFVLSLGRTGDPDRLGPIPDNFLVRDYVPQTELLHRVSAFVTHGGLNSVHESLLAGVPMVVVPLQVEEAIVASRVHECGAGIAVRLDPPYGAVDEDELRHAIGAVLADERFAKRAHELGAGLRAAGGAPRAARVILEAAGSAGPS